MTAAAAADDDVLMVARRHGTDAAAVWSGRSARAVLRLRQSVDGYDRGRGHPTFAEMAAARPSADCPCPRCGDWRESEALATQLRDERAQHERNARRAALARTMDHLVGTAEEWRLAAACLGEPPETFFGPEGAGRGRSEWVAKALAICAECTVREPCLEDSLTSTHHGIDVGIRGGLSAKQRRQLRAARSPRRESA